MAAEKTTKKPAPAKKTAKKAEIVNQKPLHEQLAEKRTDLLEARKSLRGGELVNPRVIASYRKDIARLLTAINAEKLKESK
jgi:ribosomal protein L29